MPSARRRSWVKYGLLSPDEATRSDVDPERIEIFWALGDPDLIAGLRRADGEKIARPGPPPPFPAGSAGSPRSLFDVSRAGEQIPARLAAWGFDAILCQRDIRAARAASDRSGLGALIDGLARQSPASAVALRRPGYIPRIGGTPARPPGVGCSDQLGGCTCPPIRELAILAVSAYDDQQRWLRDVLSPRPLW